MTSPSVRPHPRSRFARRSAVILAISSACAAWASACEDGDGPLLGTSSDAGLPDNHVQPLDGSAVDDAAPEPAPSCETYCTLVEDACTADNAQYRSHDECLWFCAALPAGERADRTTNSVGCRAYQAGIPAKTEPSVNCAAAGPFGNGVCGDRCTTFCQLAFALCGSEGAEVPWPSVPTCVTECTGYPYVQTPRDGGAVVDGGDGGDGGDGDGDAGSDTLNCRLALLRDVHASPRTCAQLGSPSDACR